MEELLNKVKPQLVLKNYDDESFWYNIFNDKEFYPKKDINEYLQKGKWKVLQITSTVGGAGTQYSKEFKKLIIILFEINK